MKKLPFNYHTHTARCGHASGTDREYVETAIRAGFSALGFSDHAPMPFPDGHESGFRVKMADAADYFDSIRRLREEYRGRIEIRVGLEVEYYPSVFSAFSAYIEPFRPDYLILGQHFVWEENDDTRVFADTKSPELLAAYYENLLEAAGTGKFLYIAHPDVPHYTGDEAAYEALTRDFLKRIRRFGLPLEINRLGMSDGRIYPREAFWRLAGEYGIKAVIGMDAHSPDALADAESAARCVALAERCGVELVDIPPDSPLFGRVFR